MIEKICKLNEKISLFMLIYTKLNLLVDIEELLYDKFISILVFHQINQTKMLM